MTFNGWQLSGWFKKEKKKQEPTRLDQVKKDKNKRVDSDKMTDIEKMDQGFQGNTYTINGKDVDF
tara:strand:- start:256 stop:450 length:195 start_codon:yes stop_codon:yes gene_type:complete